MNRNSRIFRVRIHPAIGIARVGDAPAQLAKIEARDDVFVGPRVPGAVETPPGGYKKDGRLKRQGAEFRLFGYDVEDRPLGEITSDDADVTWTVTLANTKAAWHKFCGLERHACLRNHEVADREALAIRPGPRSVSGRSAPPARFDDGRFSVVAGAASGVCVPLGEIVTDRHGRLVVIAGAGTSGSPDRRPLDDFANNDGWYDDVADGPVDAEVVLRSDGRRLRAVGSWVLCTVPKFAPQLENFSTLYDTLLQVMVDRGLLPAPAETAFHADILPVLRRVWNVKWTTGVGPVHDFRLVDAMRPDAPLDARRSVFARLRNPAGDQNRGLMDMPVVYDDRDKWQRSGDSGFALTQIQYDHMRNWAEGRCRVDAPPRMDAAVTPEGMDRAALEACCGGPFFPGMEAGWFLRDLYAFSEPFRLDRVQPGISGNGLGPGDVLKQMAVPWQADFFECRKADREVLSPTWWPQQRPNYVVRFGEAVPLLWTRGFAESDAAARLDMVEGWNQLGFVLARRGGYYEVDRSRSDGA